MYKKGSWDVETPMYKKLLYIQLIWMLIKLMWIFETLMFGIIWMIPRIHGELKSLNNKGGLGDVSDLNPQEFSVNSKDLIIYKLLYLVMTDCAKKNKKIVIKQISRVQEDFLDWYTGVRWNRSVLVNIDQAWPRSKGKW